MAKNTKNFSQLSEAERAIIEALLKAGHSKKYIAGELGRHISTIYRELSRNIPKRGIGAKRYNANRAGEKARQRHKTKPKFKRFTDELKQQISKLIREESLSPELIAGRRKLEGVNTVSHESIYRWIWECKHGNRRENRAYKELHKQLKHYGRRRKRKNRNENRGCLKYRVSIEKRPQAANKRKRIGDKEMDIVLGKNRKPGLLVIQDRKTRFIRLEKIQGKSATHIQKKINKAMKRFELGVKTITTDNDLAFDHHYKLAVPVYFTHPYSSHEKGSVENRIGVLRRFIPKGKDIDEIKTNEIRKIEARLNQRPMKIFNYETPSEQYYKFAFIS
jgi:IS30 family transposase